MEQLSLTECHLRLKASLGDRAPSEITLKKWSSKGKLDDARIEQGPRKRPLFNYEAVYQHALSFASSSTNTGATRQRHRDAAKAGAKDARVGAIAALDDVDLAQILGCIRLESQTSVDRISSRLVGELRDGMAEAIRCEVQSQVSAITAGLTKAIGDVGDIRRHLMTKYDAETTSLRQEISALREKDRLRDPIGMSPERTAIALSRLTDQVAGLQDLLGEVLGRLSCEQPSDAAY